MNHCIEYERWAFPPDKIKSGNIYLAASLLASSLEVNNLSATVECDEPAILNFRRNSKLLYYAEDGRPMVFRVQDIERIAPKLYQISATSTLGLLTEGQHYGGIYTGETAEAVIASICGTVPFEIKSNLRSVKLYGWLPIAAPRDNLAQVLFAIGATLKTDLDGVLRIEGLWDGVSRSVGADRMYQESSVKYEAAITSVVVTEHQYIRGSEEKSLYEGTALEGDIITFSEPMHSLTAEGFRILGQGANWAKLSAGTGTLRGSAYIHNTREVAKAVHEGSEPNVKRVTDATLVSLVNAEAVVNRLKNFYQWRETVDAPTVYQGEQPGDRMAVYHPFDKIAVASCLKSADITLSNTLKAQEKSLVGFMPEQIEEVDYYDTREVVTSNRVWTVPEGVESVRVVLIGGGAGGTRGNAGQRGSSGSTSGGSGGAGGAGGAGGPGGNIYQFSAEVTPGDQYQITIGEGGAGGQYSAGAAGGDSTFGSQTSASGSPSTAGFTDTITQEAFATPGKTGISGAAGGAASPNYMTIAFSGESVMGTNGEVYYGGGGNIPKRLGGEISSVWGGGGGGGGAAIGNDGGTGAPASTTGQISPEVKGYVVGGNGGSGASAVTPVRPVIPGSGGNGGHGGGGGGGGGSATGGVTNTPGVGGSAGSGSAGSAGADGIVILYYGVKTKKQSGQFMDHSNRALLDKLGRRFIV